MLPRAVDSQGRIYFQPLGGGPRTQLPDSAPIVRWDRVGGGRDTLALVGLPKMNVATAGSPDNRSVSMRPVPLSPEDAWAVSWDGRVAVARAGEYRVDWVYPDGSSLMGEPIPYEPVKLSRADKEEWIEGLSNGLRVGVEVENGQRRISFGRGGGGSAPNIDGFDWPESKPAFVARGVWMTPQGEAWVQRHVPAGEDVVFDVFDGEGVLKARVRFPSDRQISGFGRETVYATRTDELGLQWLERYSRPAT